MRRMDRVKILPGFFSDLMGRPRLPWLGEASRSSESLPVVLVMFDRLLEVDVSVVR